MMSRNLQLDPHGRLRHFLSVEGLKRALLVEILDLAESFAGVTEQTVKKVPLLRGKTVVNLFFESSTRTRTTFELAAKRLSADVLNLNITASATTKGETLLDTLRNLEAMHCDMFVVRHAESGAAHIIAENVAPHVHVVKALDGGDVSIALRLQNERRQGALLPSEHEYFLLFGLSDETLAAAKPDVIVMHPGPIIRGVEMASSVADGPHSVILQQVTHGIAGRMAVMAMCMGTVPLAEGRVA